MSGFVFYPAAIADLDEIWEYIATDSLAAADRVLGEIHETIQSLVGFPEMGHVRNDLASRPIRFHAVHDFLIAYAPDEKAAACSCDPSWPPEPSQHRCAGEPKILCTLPTAVFCFFKAERRSHRRTPLRKSL